MLGKFNRDADFTFEVETSLERHEIERTARTLTNGQSFAGYTLHPQEAGGTTVLFSVRKFDKEVSQFELWISKELCTINAGLPAGRWVVIVEWSSKTVEAMSANGSRVMIAAVAGMPGRKALADFASRFESALRTTDPTSCRPQPGWSN
ncbi:MAG: hypothetical protein ACT4QF_20580 [Sporichthyaceae bacterium]